MNAKAINAIILVYVGCGLNNVFLEYLVRQEPGTGNLITFSQFLFIAIHGFIFTSKFGQAPRIIPLRDYFTLVVLFFITSILNNWVFDFNIPVPLHMIFRAGSLIANMVMGIIILKKRYTFAKFLSVVMISVGIAICTIVSSTNKTSTCTNCDMKIPIDTEKEDADMFWWLIGIILLSASLFLSARMGIYQESIYKTHGKHPSEALYYTHMLSLPAFLIYAPSIIDHMEIVARSEIMEIPIIEYSMPILLFYLIGNVLTQYLCISSVYVLTTECSSLTVTLVITLRKFLSLLFSIMYFKNPFTYIHWIGTALVFVGTLIFTEVLQKLVLVPNTKEKAKTS
ncbi:UAA transporter family [Popillia japonica]|uniref:UAA transporter family n=1 Tax=Popillia japonica TaxID=7064 RepID=A0AAW1KPK5_POPJA